MGRFLLLSQVARWQRLRDNIELNEIANIQVVKAAVADGVGSALLHLADDRHNGQNTLGRHFAYYGTASGLEEAVDLISIDEFFRTNHIYRLDVIKLDIEGAEYRALVGGSATIAGFRPIVIFRVERHDADIEWKQCRGPAAVFLGSLNISL